jgi:pyruvate,water dikinase
LVEAGVLDRPDDVLYLLPPEIDGALAGGGGGDLRAAVAERRAEHEHWMTKVPPVVVGGVREDGTTAEAELTPFAAAFVPPPPPSEGPVDGVIRGLAVSRGVAKGTARVIVDLADADRFEPGDVLVCVMTSPPWTPLFALASAVVADTGGMGSHPAIAAREYGIPCVLGTAHGTRSIPDGAVVVVDGEQGTVELVDIRPA